MAQLKLEKIRKSYGDIKILKGIDLDIGDGEFMVFVGPSGCGKSTLLRMIAGLESITDGEMHLDGALINKLEPVKRGMAMVFQSYALYPHMTVAENMGFSLRIAKRPRSEIDDKVFAAARALQLEPYLKRLPKDLSGGQRQRVAIGRAIVRDPKVFLFDEPLSNLDAKMRVEMRKEILQLHARLSTTMIYVTHDQVEAMTLGDRICVMNGGIMQQVGTPAEVFDEPANIFVAGFIGTPPMNLISGVLEEQNGQTAFIGEGVQATLPEKMRNILSEHSRRKVILGLRPKSFTLAGNGEPENTRIWTGEREVTEMLGEDALVHLSIGSGKIVINVEPHALDGIGTQVRFIPQMNRAHIFDQETGRNLTLGLDLPGRRSVRK